MYINIKTKAVYVAIFKIMNLEKGVLQRLSSTDLIFTFILIYNACCYYSVENLVICIRFIAIVSLHSCCGHTHMHEHQPNSLCAMCICVT